ncbi:MAG: HNH endonuclease [Planctomycetes bacterium]|nr:HNH endonuclease [Planctomycetota bacterium]
MRTYGKCPVCGKPIRKIQRVTCSRQCGIRKRAEASRGPDNPDWKGGRYVEPGKGYILVRNPKHPRARQNGYVLEHILVMEKKLGRPLRDKEVIHHVNGQPADNRPENLVIHQSNGDHLKTRGHHRKRQPPCACGRIALARGMCSRCYVYLRRTGTTRPLVDYDGRLRPLDAP